MLESLFHKFTGFQASYLVKKRSITSVFLEYCEILKVHYICVLVSLLLTLNRFNIVPPLFNLNELMPAGILMPVFFIMFAVN